MPLGVYALPPSSPTTQVDEAGFVAVLPPPKLMRRQVRRPWLIAQSLFNRCSTIVQAQVSRTLSYFNEHEAKLGHVDEVWELKHKGPLRNFQSGS